MTIKAYVARLDDYTGELAMNLKSLENAAVHGEGDPDRVVEFLDEVQLKAFQADLSPWRWRAISSLVGAAAVIALWEAVEYLAPDQAEKWGVWLDLLPFLGLLALLFAVGSFLVYSWRQKTEMVWFENLKSAVRGGGSINDLFQE